MPRYESYQVFAGSDLSVSMRVNDAIRDGFEPYGFPVVNASGAIVQAVVKYKRDGLSDQEQQEFTAALERQGHLEDSRLDIQGTLLGA